MRISVVIPSFNSARFLPETIDSVVEQTMEDWELIVVNDGSTDNTGETAEQLAAHNSRIRVIHIENRGLPGARNAGYRTTYYNSEFVCFLDADDILEPDSFKILTGVLDEQTDKLAAHGLPTAIDADSKPIRPGQLEAHFRERWCVIGGKLMPCPTHEPTSFACEVVSNYIATSGTTLIRRSALETVGLFDERMKSCEDWDLWLRICRLGAIAFIDQPLLKYRIHGNNMSSKSKTMAEAELFLRKKLLTWPNDTEENRQIARWGYRYRALQISRYRLAWAKGAIRQGKVVHAANELRHAMLAYCLYRYGPKADFAMDFQHQLEK